MLRRDLEMASLRLTELEQPLWWDLEMLSLHLMDLELLKTQLKSRLAQRAVILEAWMNGPQLFSVERCVVLRRLPSRRIWGPEGVTELL